MKRTRFVFGCVGVGVMTAMLVFAQATMGDILYTVTDLGTLGGNVSYALAINGQGRVVGQSTFTTPSPAFHAFRTMPGAGIGPITDALGNLGGGAGCAYGINGSGETVGDSWTASGEVHAFYYATNGPMQDIGTLGGSTSRATDISDSGLVVGVSTNAAGVQRAFYGQRSGTPQDLGTLGGSASAANAVSATGRIAGRADDATSASHAFLWDDSYVTGPVGNPHMRDLGTLGGTSSEATDINSLGAVVGWANPAGNTEAHAFLWIAGATHGSAANPEMRDLGTFGGTHSFAYGVNDDGLVVGEAHTTGNAEQRAFVFAGNQLTDLNTLVDPLAGWRLVEAQDINNAGQILGYGWYDPDGAGPIAGEYHGFLLSPVPEPGTASVVAVALVLAMARRRRMS